MAMQPTLRLKKRYLTFKVTIPLQNPSSTSIPHFTPQELEAATQQALLTFLGEFGVAKATPIFLKERCKDNTFVIKVNHTSVEPCRAALILIKKIKNTPVIMQSITTSGTLKKAVERTNLRSKQQTAK